MPAEFLKASRTQFPAPWHAPLVQRGFDLTDSGYQRGAFQFHCARRWFVLSERPEAQNEYALASSLNQVGLWKLAQNGGAPQRVFEIPSWALRSPADEDRFDDHDLAPFEKLLDWALESSFGRVPADWQPPARDLIESWLPRGALTVHADGLVRQGELMLRHDRWALRIPLLPQLPDDLPEARRRALRELLFDAQSRWAMVRFGIPADTDNRALVAEVDLSGAPVSEPLFSAGLDVLRHVCARLVETADVLADASVVIESLALDCNHNKPNERKEP